jgi:hypothetical protein
VDQRSPRHGRLRSSCYRTPRGSTVASTLLERDRELDLLSGMVSGLAASGGLVVLIRGEAGIDKTALVD